VSEWSDSRYTHRAKHDRAVTLQIAMLPNSSQLTRPDFAAGTRASRFRSEGGRGGCKNESNQEARKQGGKEARRQGGKEARRRGRLKESRVKARGGTRRRTVHVHAAQVRRVARHAAAHVWVPGVCGLCEEDEQEREDEGDKVEREAGRQAGREVHAGGGGLVGMYPVDEQRYRCRCRHRCRCWSRCWSRCSM
jgi:hypothetical protein